MAGKIMKPRWKPITAIFLNRCNSQVHSKYLAHRWVQFSFLITETSFCSSQRPWQRPTTGQNAENTDDGGQSPTETSTATTPIPKAQVMSWRKGRKESKKKRTVIPAAKWCLYTTGSYTHKISIIWLLKQDLHKGNISWYSNREITRPQL